MNSYEEILQRMEEAYEQKSGCKVADVSEVGLRMRVLAGELYRLETSLDWLERQAFPQTASGEQLDLHGAQRASPVGRRKRPQVWCPFPGTCLCLSTWWYPRARSAPLLGSRWWSTKPRRTLCWFPAS